MISMLIASRKNDKFLSKMLFSIMTKTKDFKNIEVLVMASRADEWNMDLFEYFGDRVKFYFEEHNYGNRGLHIYFNDLAAVSSGDYLWYLCSDHDILLKDYDEFILDYIKEKELSKDKIWGIVPGMRDCGPVSHIISRKFYEVVGRIAESDKIDSWYNDILYRLPEDRLHVMSGTQVMTDYTPQYNFILSSDHSNSGGQIDPPGHLQNGSDAYHQTINSEAEKLKKAIENGA